MIPRRFSGSFCCRVIRIVLGCRLGRRNFRRCYCRRLASCSRPGFCRRVAAPAPPKPGLPRRVPPGLPPPPLESTPPRVSAATAAALAPPPPLGAASTRRRAASATRRSPAAARRPRRDPAARTAPRSAAPATRPAPRPESRSAPPRQHRAPWVRTASCCSSALGRPPDKSPHSPDYTRRSPP